MRDGPILHRVLMTGLSICLMTPVLAGCSPDYPVAARIIDSELTFVVCDARAAQRISVLVVDPGPDDPNPPTYWQADGDGDVSPDEPITYGEPPEDFENVIAPLPLPSDDSRILIHVDTVDDSGDVVWRVGGNYVASWLSDAYWLQTGGGHSAEPCS